MATNKNIGIVLDEYQNKVLNYVADGDNLFITGKAGTGKTELLKAIRRMYEGKKVVAVLAPTGVAAKNAGGYTMHSFLQLPLKPYLPEHKVKPDLYQQNYVLNTASLSALFYQEFLRLQEQIQLG